MARHKDYSKQPVNEEAKQQIEEAKVETVEVKEETVAKPVVAQKSAADIFAESLVSDREYKPACEDPDREAKLADGWVLIAEDMPLVPPGAADMLAEGYDPRADGNELMGALGSRVQHSYEAPRPEVPSIIEGTPFKSRQAWKAYAPEKSGDLDNAWGLKMRLAMNFNSNFRATKDWKEAIILLSTDALPSNKTFIKTGIAYDNALFRKPYILKINPELVYGRRINGVHYDMGIELADQRVFDIDGEAAILIRCNGTSTDSRGNPFWLKRDSPYIADIQFLLSPIG